MTCTDHPLPAPTAARSDDSTLFAALELSRKSWLVATSSPGEARISKRVVTAGDGPGLLALLGKLSMTELFLLAVVIVGLKGVGVGRVETAWGLYLFGGVVLASLGTSLWADKALGAIAAASPRNSTPS